MGDAMSCNQLIPTIMVADSNEDDRCLLKSILELKGFQVFEAIDGQEAIEIAVRKRPDLLAISAIPAADQFLRCKVQRDEFQRGGYRPES